MQLGLTIPLMKHLKVKKLSYGEELHRRFCWDLHCIRLHNHSCLLAVHCETRYIERYLQDAGEIELTKTHGRREVAFLNRAWDDVAALDYCIDREQQSQPLIENSINNMICNCVGYEGYGEPMARLRQSLEEKIT